MEFKDLTCYEEVVANEWEIMKDNFFANTNLILSIKDIKKITEYLISDNDYLVVLVQDSIFKYIENNFKTKNETKTIYIRNKEERK